MSVTFPIASKGRRMTTLSDLLAEYVERTRPKPDTVRLFRLAIRQFSLSLLRPATIEDLTEERMLQHLTRRTNKGTAAGTIAGEQRKIYALWRFAAKQGYVAKWPTSHPVRVPERIPRAWTADELRKLFQATAFATECDGPGSALWWRCLFSLLWDTGERIAAVRNIRWDNVDLDGQTVYIPAEDRKGGAVDRLYPIAQETAQLLRQMSRDKRPFWTPFGVSTLYRRLTRMLTKAGLPADRRSKFHRIRRSTASHYEAAGGNATELLGHTSRKVTRGYLDPRIVRPTSAVDVLFRPDSGEHDANG